MDFVIHNFYDTYSIIFFSIITLIYIIILFYGNYLLINHIYIEYFYFFIITLIYFIILALYYLKWKLETIFILILIINFFIGIIAFFLLIYNQEICGKNSKSSFDYSYLALIFMIIIIVLTKFINYNSWNYYDLIIVILALFFIRLNYYYLDTKSILKTFNDITLLYLIFVFGKKIYYLK
jgi:hypothetical protein